MTACFESQSRSTFRTLGLAAVFCALSAVLAISILSTLRGRVSPADLADLDPRLLGPDVLGERMVVPPSIPDWVFMDCQKDSNAPGTEVGSSSATLINRVRQSICNRG